MATSSQILDTKKTKQENYEVLYFHVTIFLVKKKERLLYKLCQQCRDVLDTTLLDTRFNRIVIYQIPDSSKFKHES